MKRKPPVLRSYGFLFFSFLLLAVFASSVFAYPKKDSMPVEELTKQGAKYVGSDTCGACHTKEVREFTKSTHAKFSLPGEGHEVQGCEMCHGPASLHLDAGGGKKNILNPKSDVGSCFQCHSEKQMQFKRPNHHPVMEGKMNCTSCHSAHGDDARPWSATTMSSVNETCFNCHKEQRGPFVFEHEALREGCTTCHEVHGSLHSKMLVARDNNLCLRCHTQMNFPTVGKQNHGGRFPQGTCFTAGCHTAVHGSNFDDHLRY